MKMLSNIPRIANLSTSASSQSYKRLWSEVSSKKLFEFRNKEKIQPKNPLKKMLSYLDEDSAKAYFFSSKKIMENVKNALSKE